jgi:hypothetical protein
MFFGNNRTIQILAYSLCFCVFAACHTTQATTGSKLNDISSILQFLGSQQINYKTFNSKLKLKYTKDKNSQTVDVKLRMVKDSVIWASVGLLGLEGARAFITPDSVKLLNRMEQTYTLADFRYLQKKYGVAIKFNELQDLLIGNAIHLAPKDFKLSKDATSRNVLTKNIDGATLSYTLENTENRLAECIMQDLREQWSFVCLYRDYQVALNNDRKIALERVISANSVETGDLSAEMRFTKIEVDNLDFNIEFSIPTTYERREP